jgi:hypothetical protein
LSHEPPAQPSEKTRHTRPSCGAVKVLAKVWRAGQSEAEQTPMKCDSCRTSTKFATPQCLRIQKGHETECSYDLGLLLCRKTLNLGVTRNAGARHPPPVEWRWTRLAPENQNSADLVMISRPSLDHSYSDESNPPQSDPPILPYSTTGTALAPSHAGCRKPRTQLSSCYFAGSPSRVDTIQSG